MPDEEYASICRKNAIELLLQKKCNSSYIAKKMQWRQYEDCIDGRRGGKFSTQREGVDGEF